MALLIGELAIPGQTVGEHVKAPVLIASVTAAVLAAALRRRNAPTSASTRKRPSARMPTASPTSTSAER
ncbi:hypothetical protein OG264_00490 [Streptomyces xanthophaeus]|uniref:hypothetical protein n=1 Tax=Streptomyces xanthophaeus TaxID=67385 RepID=UPI00386D8BBF|nr:hypothetical protein OG264_00490 [Streptomyces xanthophaeus]WST64912.1 hypothetical protein OG605_37870 [Streptomyces xanthophaeus]